MSLLAKRPCSSLVAFFAFARAVLERWAGDTTFLRLSFFGPPNFGAEVMRGASLFGNGSIAGGWIWRCVMATSPMPVVLFQ
jgi:hypothetical protein